MPLLLFNYEIIIITIIFLLIVATVVPLSLYLLLSQHSFLNIRQYMHRASQAILKLFLLTILRINCIVPVLCPRQYVQV